LEANLEAYDFLRSQKHFL